MSRPVGFDTSDHPREPRPPLFRVMIGCGIAGLLIAIGAAVVDFGTGRHSREPSLDAPRLGPPPSAPARLAPPDRASIVADRRP